MVTHIVSSDNDNDDDDINYDDDNNSRTSSNNWKSTQRVQTSAKADYTMHHTSRNALLNTDKWRHLMITHKIVMHQSECSVSQC